MELVGWLSGVLLAGCMLPQAIKVVVDGNATGTSWGMLVAWAAGEVLGVAYIATLAKIPWPVLVNYGANTLLSAVLLGYKVRDGRRVH